MRVQRFSHMGIGDFICSSRGFGHGKSGEGVAGVENEWTSSLRRANACLMRLRKQKMFGASDGRPLLDRQRPKPHVSSSRTLRAARV